ncbi:MAG: protein translocase subunit SecD [Planctomycetota bacterium]
MNSKLQNERSAVALLALSKIAFLVLTMVSLTFTVAQAQEDPGAAAAAGDVAGKTVESEAALDAAANAGSAGALMLAIVIAIFVLPVIVGGWLAKSVRMPEYGWKFAVAIGTLAAAAVVVYQGQVKYGPDLSGGITLIYELQDTTIEEEDLEDDGSGESIAERSTRATRQLVKELIAALSERVDPSGTKEVTIREYGLGQIEIIIPRVGQQEQEFIERRISTAGALEFRIVASPVFTKHREIIELAQALPPGEREVRRGGNVVAEWMEYDADHFGGIDSPDPRLVKRMAGTQPQALVLMNDGVNVTGDYLKQTSAGIDEKGEPQVNFSFDQQGAYLFGRLSGQHTPNSAGQEYNLGIILDKRVLRAPSIISKITSQGRISGGMLQEDVDFIVGILNAGSLPATLNKEPISRQTISPTLGEETVAKARTAITYSLIAVMVFMLFYYRFAGIVACLALGANLLLILGFMVLFNAAFTLPGLAGLVLTIGMSVDANVLIFERIREERKRGAALRMAIRNGFGRATQTIVDANVTTLITAIVIYKIAPDNVKGFGVTLIIGIVMSMYAAIFLSRLVFDVAEKLGSIRELGMGQIIGQTNINFLGKRTVAAIASVALISVGLVAVSNRGTDLLNIDFTGGSSVTMVFDSGQELSFSEVKQQLAEKTDLAEKNLSLVEVGERGTGKQYTVSCVEQDVEAVQQILQEAFGDRLKTYEVEASAVESLGVTTGATDTSRTDFVSLVSFQDESANEETPVEETPTTESSSDEAPDAEIEVADDNETSDAEDDATVEGDDSADETPSEDSGEPVDPFAGGSTFELNFQAGGDGGGLNFDTVRQLIQDALDETDHSGAAFSVSNPNYQTGSARSFDKWDVKVALPTDQAEELVTNLKTKASSQPVFPLANKIGGRVAGDMKTKAIAAIIISLIGIVAYIWLRFQHVMYGLAAVVALIHDVLVTLGMIALSAWIVSNIPGLAEGLMIEKFQISLPIVAAFLTIIGYSLNDTIVVFDRIREVKGKSPNLTADMINNSINQTLSRTLLTSLTTFLSVILLYFLGGDGIHGFAFALVVGVIVGTYSSIFIASPTLLWMSQRSQQASPQPGRRAA